MSLHAAGQKVAESCNCVNTRSRVYVPLRPLVERAKAEKVLCPQNRTPFITFHERSGAPDLTKNHRARSRDQHMCHTRRLHRSHSPAPSIHAPWRLCTPTTRTRAHVDHAKPPRWGGGGGGCNFCMHAATPPPTSRMAPVAASIASAPGAPAPAPSPHRPATHGSTRVLGAARRAAAAAAGGGRAPACGLGPSTAGGLDGPLVGTRGPLPSGT
jgi:hypothetical protein